MKKGLLVLVPALFLSLTACDLSSLANQLGGGDDDDESSEQAGDNSNGNNQGSDDDAIFDKTESIDKLMAYGKDTGFEIVTSSSESDSASASSFALGMKGNVWLPGKSDGLRRMCAVL